MEKISKSSFGKFEGFGLSNLQMIKGGKMEETLLTGSGCRPAGEGTYYNWSSDSLTGNQLTVEGVYYSTYNTQGSGAC